MTNACANSMTTVEARLRGRQPHARKLRLSSLAALQHHEGIHRFRSSVRFPQWVPAFISCSRRRWVYGRIPGNTLGGSPMHMWRAVIGFFVAAAALVGIVKAAEGGTGGGSSEGGGEG